MQEYTREVLSVLRGLNSYYRGHEISAESRKAVLDLFCKTNGRFTDQLATVLRIARPRRRPARTSGLLGEFSVAEQQRIAKSIERDGFYVFEQRIPGEVCDDIERFASSTPAILEGGSRTVDARVKFDPQATPLSKKYYFAEDELTSNQGMQQLMGDPALLAIAETYLGTLPMLSDVTLWWSAVHAGANGFDAGQNYHFDFDTPPQWLMLFVYLTDVGPENGPHMYVRGSHRSEKSAALRARGYVRLTDEDVDNAFGRDSVVELRGKRGTVLAVDTMGFHKGKPLSSGFRLMGQLIYSFAQFTGAHQQRQPLGTNVDPALSAALARVPRVYKKYL